MSFKTSLEQHLFGLAFPEELARQQAELTASAELEARLLRAELVDLVANMFKHGASTSEGLTALGHAEGVLKDSRRAA